MSASPAPTEEVLLLRKWTRSALHDLETPELEKLALSLAHSLSVGQIVLGRIMVVLDAGKIADFWGCNSGKHFGRLVLQLTDRQVDDFYRVAKALESLPLLTRKVEEGLLGWSKIREIVRKATPETEEFWVRMAATRSAPQIERLVARCPKGGLPGDGILRETQRLERCRLDIGCDEEDRDLFQEGVAQLSQELGFRVTLLEAMRYFFLEHRLGERRANAKRYESVMDWADEMRVQGTQRDRQDAADARREAAELGLDPASEEPGPAEGPSWVEAEGQVEVAAEAEEPDQGETVAEAPGQVEAAVEAEVPSWVLEPPVLPYANPASAAGEVREPESEYALPTTPWAAFGIVEEPIPGAPGLLLGSRCLDPSWFAAGESVLPPGATFDRRGRLRFNPNSRTVTPGQAEYVRRRDGARCAVPGCRCWIWANSHHIVWYCRGGPTVPDNLVLVCTRCHKRIHEERLFVEGDAETRLTWRDHRGRILGLDCRPDPARREPLLPGEGGGPFRRVAGDGDG